MASLLARLGRSRQVAFPLAGRFADLGYASSSPSSLSSSSSFFSSSPSGNFCHERNLLAFSLLRNFSGAASAVKTLKLAQNPGHAAGGEFVDRLKRWKPVTPSLRHTILVDKSHLWKGRPVKELTKGLRKSGGRGHGGKISVRHIGGGFKRLYRFVDFKRNLFDKPAVVQRFEYDPNRTCYIALIAYEDGTVSYILAPRDLKVGDQIMSSRTNEIEIKIGNCMPIKTMPLGTLFHNMEIKPGMGGQIARSAGTSCQLIDKMGKKGFCLVQISSREQRYVREDALGTIGTLSNPLHNQQSLGKAGRNRNKGIRPTVRGMAMNPIDHAMGGGNGKSKGRHSCAFNGLLSIGYKTVRKVRNNLIVVKRGGGTEARVKKKKK